MNLHTPKGASTLGTRVSVDSRMFKEWVQGSKPNGLNFFYIIGKLLKCRYLKWTRMTHLDIWNISYGQKKGPWVKLPIWLLTIKSWESIRFHCVQVPNDISLERTWQGIQLCFRFHLNQRSTHKVMGLQSRESPNENPNFGNFGTPIWES
jgi:hypothetical protein